MTPTTAVTALQGLYAVLAGGRGQGTQAGLVETLTDLQALRNVIDACETEAMGQLAAIEIVQVEDGTWGERHHGVGHQEMDAPELVAPCLGVSVQVASSRMLTAVHQLSRMPQLVEEMAAGRLDGYRARVITDELSDAPVATAAAVVAELCAHAHAVGGWQDTPGPLRRRTAAVLARIDEAVLAARVKHERSRRGLSRRVESSGMDKWEGFYPVEESRLAWEAIDVIARRLLADGSADNLYQARSDAHLQLLLGQVTATVHLHPTHPAAAAATATATHVAASDESADKADHRPNAADSTDQAPSDQNPAAPESVPAAAAGTHASPTGPSSAAKHAREADRDSAASKSSDVPNEPEVGPATTDVPNEPEVGPATTDVPNEPEVGPATTDVPNEPEVGPATTDDPREPDVEPAHTSLGEGEVVPVGGYGGLGSALLPTHWLAEGRDSGRVVNADPVLCHPDSGAAHAIPPSMTRGPTRATKHVGEREDRYRPSIRLRDLIRLRDGTCRFPGCQVRASACDLDHVTPWPAGPTAPDNLMALCRRHHQLKQRLQWRVRLHPDATVTWWYPDGRILTTHPVDHLGTTRPLLTDHARDTAARNAHAHGHAQADGATRGTSQPTGESTATAQHVPDSSYDLGENSALLETLTRYALDHGWRPGYAPTPAQRAHARALAREEDLRRLHDTPVPTITIAGITFSTRTRTQTLAAYRGDPAPITYTWSLWSYADPPF